MRGSFLGPSFSNQEIEAFLAELGVNHTSIARLEDGLLFERTANELAAGKVIGWFQGRMEVRFHELSEREASSATPGARRCNR